MKTRILFSDNGFNLFFMVHNRLGIIVNDETVSVILTDTTNLSAKFYKIKLQIK